MPSGNAWNLGFPGLHPGYRSTLDTLLAQPGLQLR